ncbi:MAG: bifunctional 3,4-dihydroxy-2-butanone-4-phosphate synthase/GTP cyclohydrolase II, partial [Gammaproteobacteria bacterium]
YAYQDRNDNNLHLALVMGKVAGYEPVLVRVHARNLLGDLFASRRNDSAISLRDAMKKIAEEGKGVLVVIRQEEDNKALIEKIHQFQMEDHGVIIKNKVENPVDWRTTGAGSQILADLGVHKLRVYGTQKKYFGLSGFELEVVEYVNHTDGTEEK